jgi:hypothetical protein
MKKKTILLVLCAVLLLIFTSSSHGGFDPKYKERMQAHPDQELLTPANGNQLDYVLLLIAPSWSGFSLFTCIKNDPAKHDLNSERVIVVGQACPQGLLDRKESSPEFQEAESK